MPTPANADPTTPLIRLVEAVNAAPPIGDPPFAVRAADEGRWLVVRCEGKALRPLPTADAARLAALVSHPGAKRVVIDLSRCDYVNSTFLAFFVTMHKRAAQAGNRVVLACPTANVDEVLKVVGFAGVLPILPDWQAVERHFAAG